jgi:hypothetical protein
MPLAAPVSPVRDNVQKPASQALHFRTCIIQLNGKLLSGVCSRGSQK